MTEASEAMMRRIAREEIAAAARLDGVSIARRIRKMLIEHDVRRAARLFDAEVAAGVRVEEELDDVVEQLHRRLCEHDEVGAQTVDRDALGRWFRLCRADPGVRFDLAIGDLTQPVSEGAAQLQELLVEDAGEYRSAYTHRVPRAVQLVLSDFWVAHRAEVDDLLAPFGLTAEDVLMPTFRAVDR